MQITLDMLRAYTELPSDPAQARALLDDVGLEVKRIDFDVPGVPINLELLANRGDHHCFVGLATEVSGRTGAPVHAPLMQPPPVREGLVRVHVEATDLCPVYTLTSLRRGVGGTLSPRVGALLAACGLSHVHDVVDATNALLKEVGQPTHAFDADKIEGQVTVRLSRSGERALPLFAAEPVALPEGLLVIADDVKVLAIAGVIGCQESATSQDTEHVLLESAYFDPVSVRKASRALGMHTDSSARFERGADASLALRAVGRLLQMLGDTWVLAEPSEQWNTWRDPLRAIDFDADAARAFLAIDESDDKLIARLVRYGFKPAPDTRFDPRTRKPLRPGGVVMQVPPHRLHDCETPADLFEELAKSIGYNQIVSTLPRVDMGALPSAAERALDTVAEVLVSQGFYEVITDGFYGRAMPDLLGWSEVHPLRVHVQTTNALDRGYALLKNQCLGQALDGVAINTRYGVRDVKCFEFTRTFHPPARKGGPVQEHRLLWALATGEATPSTWEARGRAFDPHHFVGIVREIGAALGLGLRVKTSAEDETLRPIASALHPTRRALILLGEQVVGVLGEVHPSVVERFKLKRMRPVYLEIDREALVVQGSRPVFVEPPRNPPVSRALAFFVPKGVETAAICATLAGAGGDKLVHVVQTDRFVSEELGQGAVWTFTLWWDASSGAASVDVLNAQTEAAADAVIEAWQAEGVRRRSG